jgi:limonene-1,2-epoxide hydrolase
MPVVGVTEFRDGKISAWREYFDTAPFEKLLSGD